MGEKECRVDPLLNIPGLVVVVGVETGVVVVGVATGVVVVDVATGVVVVVGTTCDDVVSSVVAAREDDVEI